MTAEGSRAERFRGWPPDMVAFFTELATDNTREFWRSNRHRYDSAVRAPMEALVEELEPEFGAGKVFRPYRDVRFSRDKSPYKTSCYAVLHRPGNASACYLRVDAGGLTAGGGAYAMTPDQLARFRAAIDDEQAGSELADLVVALREQGFETAPPALKVAPRGWSTDHRRIDLLRLRDMTVVRSAPPGPQVHTDRALAFVRECFERPAELFAWLDRHVGPAAERARR